MLIYLLLKLKGTYEKPPSVVIWLSQYIHFRQQNGKTSKKAQVKAPRRRQRDGNTPQVTGWRGGKAPLCVCYWGACPQVESLAGLGAHTSSGQQTRPGGTDNTGAQVCLGIHGLSHRWPFWRNSDLTAFKWRRTKRSKGTQTRWGNIGRSDTSSPSCQMLDGGRSKCFRESWQMTRN